MLVNGSQTQIRSRAYTEANIIPFPQGRSEDTNYRSTGIAGRPSLKDALGRELPAYMHDRHIAISFLAYRTNPMAHRLIEMEVNFVLGNGISLTCFDSPETLAIISAWWNDPYNNWPARISQRLRDLYLYGEWLHRPLVHPTSGFLFIRDTQPDNIDHLLPDPFDHSQIDKIVLKQKSTGTDASMPHMWGYNIRERLDEATAELSPASGDFFHSGINRTTDSLRGIGELFPLLDYIDMYDSILFSRAEKIENMSHVYYDLLLEGMSEAEMRDYLVKETNVPPRPGSVWAHNAQATLTTVTADLKADDHSTDVSVLKSHIVSSAGWPGTWFDENGGGRASAAEMSEGALKNITQLQATIAQILRVEIDYMIMQAVASGTFTPASTKVNRLGIPHYAISFSRPTAKDIQRMGPSLARYGDFINTITSQVPLLTQEEGRQLVVAQIQQLGLNDAPMSMELPTSLPKIPGPKDPNQMPPTVIGAPGVPGVPGAANAKNVGSPATSAKVAAKVAEEAQMLSGTHVSQLFEKLY